MKIEKITFLKNKSSNTDSDNRGDGTAEGWPDLDGAAPGLAEDELVEAGGAVPHALHGRRRPGHSSVPDRRRGSARTFGSDDGEGMKRRRNFQRSWEGSFIGGGRRQSGRPPASVSAEKTGKEARITSREAYFNSTFSGYFLKLYLANNYSEN